MNFENLIQLTVPIIGFVVAIVSAGLSYYFAKRQQIVSDERRLKEKCYLEYIYALSENVNSSDIEQSRSKLSEAHNQILLLGHAEVVRNLRTFSYYISPENKEKFNIDMHDQLLTALIKSMRLDLYKKRRVNFKYPTISLSGKNKR